MISFYVFFDPMWFNKFIGGNHRKGPPRFREKKTPKFISLPHDTKTT